MFINCESANTNEVFGKQPNTQLPEHVTLKWIENIDLYSTPFQSLRLVQTFGAASVPHLIIIIRLHYLELVSLDLAHIKESTCVYSGGMGNFLTLRPAGGFTCTLFVWSPTHHCLFRLELIKI